MEKENLKQVPEDVKVDLGAEVSSATKVEPIIREDIKEEKPSDLGVTVADKDEYNVEVIEDYNSIDVFHLSKKDPKYEYRFLRADSKNLSIKTGNILYQKGGWQLVPRQHLVKIGIQERYIAPDGTYRVGDTVLARIPKELADKKEEYKKKRANEPVDAIKRLVEKGDSNVGKEIHDSMKGIQTQKKLGM